MGALSAFARGFAQGFVSEDGVPRKLTSTKKRPSVKRRPDAAATPPAASRGTSPELGRRVFTAEELEQRAERLEDA